MVERDGVLKCKGKLSNADLEIEAREPMTLPKEHYNLNNYYRLS